MSKYKKDLADEILKELESSTNLTTIKPHTIARNRKDRFSLCSPPDGTSYVLSFDNICLRVYLTRHPLLHYRCYKLVTKAKREQARRNRVQNEKLIQDALSKLKET